MYSTVCLACRNGGKKPATVYFGGAPLAEDLGGFGAAAPDLWTPALTVAFADRLMERLHCKFVIIYTVVRPALGTELD